MELTFLSDSDFSTFVEGKKSNNFLQSVEMYHRYKNNGTESYLLGLLRNDKKVARTSGNILAAALVRVSTTRLGRVFKVSGGPILDYDGKDAKKILTDFTRVLSDFAREKSAIALQISPNLLSEPRDNDGNVIKGKTNLDLKKHLTDKLGFKYLGEFENAKWTYIIPTEGRPEDVLWKNLRRNHQRLIKRAKETPVTIRDLKPDELPILKSIASEAGERHGFPDPPLSYYEEMRSAFGKKSRFLVAELEEDGKKKPIMAGMFIYYGTEVVCPYSGSLRAYQRYGGAHLMHWTVLNDCRERGYKRYNLYGTAPIPGSGVFGFKQGFNGTIEELLGTFILPLSLKGKIYLATKKEKTYGTIH